MNAISKYLRAAENNVIAYYCPGCKESHAINSVSWHWNGSLDKPTFSPSILVTSGHYMQEYQALYPNECYCNFKERTGMESSFKCYRCHSFINDGMIQFLSDCTHELANQIVPIPEWNNL